MAQVDRKRLLGFVFLVCLCSLMGVVKRSAVQSLIDADKTSQKASDLSMIDSADQTTSVLANQSSYNFICKNQTIYEFPNDFMSPEAEYKGGLLVHALIIIYLLGGITIVCDHHFVSALSRISQDLNLKEDVAAATFMAAGTSAPELFTSIIGVVVAKSDIGIGTIVGSALFNVFFIIGICGIVANKATKIDFYPMTRDCLFYGISIICLMLVFYDGQIQYYEAILVILVYVVYIVMMYYNDKIEKWVKNKAEKSDDKPTNKVEAEGHVGPIFEVKFDLEDDLEFRNERAIDVEEPAAGGEDEDKEKFDPFDFKKDSGLAMQLLSYVFFPMKLLLFLTVPDPKRKTFNRFPFYFLSFLMSIVYVGVFTYIIVWMVVIIAYRINLPDTVAGLTLLAAGSSVPEIVSSVIVVKKGKGNMAISNSIGSNIFDLLVCLGLPWVIETVLVTPGQPVLVYGGESIVLMIGVLLASLAILLISFILCKWQLDIKLGCFMIFLWILSTGLMCLLEYGVFGNFSIPSC